MKPSKLLVNEEPFITFKSIMEVELWVSNVLYAPIGLEYPDIWKTVCILARGNNPQYRVF